MTETLHRQVDRLIKAIDEAEELHGGLLSKELLRIASETRIALAAAMRHHEVDRLPGLAALSEKGRE